MPAEQIANPILPDAVTRKRLPVKGWHQYLLYDHPSPFGPFSVEVVTSDEQRVAGVFLSHVHTFYERNTPEDTERRAFHDGVIATELLGQREFSWGHVFCRVDHKENRDWLVVIYSPFSHVPLHRHEIYRALSAHEHPPEA
ncbi:hypothetical protein BH09VER1_BH09VER1_04310 [soil metagenome]